MLHFFFKLTMLDKHFVFVLIYCSHILHTQDCLQRNKGTKQYFHPPTVCTCLYSQGQCGCIKSFNSNTRLLCWYRSHLCVCVCTSSYRVLQMICNLWPSCLWWLSHRSVWSFSPLDAVFSLRLHQPGLLSCGWVRAWRTSLILHRELPGVGFNRRRWNTDCS